MANRGEHNDPRAFVEIILSCCSITDILSLYIFLRIYSKRFWISSKKLTHFHEINVTNVRNLGKK